MKRIVLIICCLLLLSGCKSQTAELPKEDIKINLPTDDTVNGYRNEDYESDDLIPKDDVGVDTETNSISYCGNKNSKIFHKSSCASVKKTKESNKIFFTSKEEYLNNGYKPCQSCNP